MADDGRDRESIYLTTAQMRRIAAPGQRSSITVGSQRQCGTLPVKGFSCRATTSQQTWKILVLVSPSVDVSYKAADGSEVAFQSAFTRDELTAIRQSALEVPNLVASWSKGLTSATVSVVVVPDTLRSLSYVQNGVNVPEDHDIRGDLRSLAPFGSFDFVFHVWKAWNEGGGLVPTYWALSFKPSIWTQGAGTATVGVQGPREIPSPEGMVGIWLDTAALYYGGFGYGPIPALRALGNGAYAPDSNGSLATYYSDFMTGHVLGPAVTPLGGITRSMWRSGTPSTRPFSCVAVC